MESFSSGSIDIRDLPLVVYSKARYTEFAHGHIDEKANVQDVPNSAWKIRVFVSKLNLSTWYVTQIFQKA